jgi:hypothetical protein
VQADRPGRLEALDGKGKVVARATVAGAGDIRLDVPADPARVGLIRLRAVDEAGAAQPFRVFGPAGKVPRFLPPEADIVCGGELKLGRGWYPPEKYQGLVFRWAPNDAEVVLEVPSAGDQLVVDVEPGFGPNQFSCRLSLRDAAGRELAAAPLRGGRTAVRLSLPADVKAGAVLRLHAEGGGVSLPNRPKVAHFRIFSVELGVNEEVRHPLSH